MRETLWSVGEFPAIGAFRINMGLDTDRFINRHTVIFHHAFL